MESKKTITAVTLLALGCDMPGSDMTPAAQAELEKAEDIFRNTEFTKQCVALTIAVDDNDNLIRGRRVLGDTAIDIAEILLPGDASMLKLTRKVGRLDLPDSDSPFDEGVCECLQGDYRLASGDRVKRFECAARSSV